MFPFNTPWSHQEILRISYGFGEYWMETLEPNGLVLPWGVFHEVCHSTENDNSRCPDMPYTTNISRQYVSILFAHNMY